MPLVAGAGPGFTGADGVEARCVGADAAVDFGAAAAGFTGADVGFVDAADIGADLGVDLGVDIGVEWTTGFALDATVAGFATETAGEFFAVEAGTAGVLATGADTVWAGAEAATEAGGEDA